MPVRGRFKKRAGQQYHHMKILIVSQYYTPDITAAAFRMGETAELLREEGHEVRVITAQPHKADVEATPDPEVSRVEIAPPPENGGLLSYLRHYFSFLPGSIRSARRMKQNGWIPDVLWVSSPPLFTGIGGWRIKRLMRCPMVLDIRDIWPDTAVAAGQLSGGGLAYRAGRLLERFLYRRADRLTCVSKPMKEYLEREAGDRPVDVIYNGVNAEPEEEEEIDVYGYEEEVLGRLWKREEEYDFFEELKRKEREKEKERRVPPHGSNGQRKSGPPRTLMYAGNLGHLQGLEVLIEAFAELREDPEGLADNWTLRLVGGGAEEERLKKLAREHKIAGAVRFDGVRSKEETARLLEEADMLYLGLKDHPVLEKTIPSKLFDYMRAGVPIVAGIRGEGKEILELTLGNLTCGTGEAGLLAEKLRTAFRMVELMQKLARKNARVIRKHYSRRKMTRKLVRTFREAIAGYGS